MTDQPTNTAAIKALCKAQAAMPRAVKDSDNPFFKTKYADLSNVQDACLPALYENGFAVIYRLGRDDAHGYVETILLHESGIEYSCPIPLIVDKQNMQGLGSAITYARRYGLMCLSGVAPEDDDGNKAAANPPKRGNERGKVVDDTPPPAKVIDKDTTMFTAEAIQKVIATLQNIWGEAELVGYWSGLALTQPGMQSAPGVAEAKDAQKAIIAANKEDAE